MKKEEQVLIKCIFCKANFRTKVFLEKHIMEKHVIRKDNLLYCPYCILVTDNEQKYETPYREPRTWQERNNRLFSISL